MLDIKGRYFALAGTLTAAGGLAFAMAPAAQASSFQCVTSNGCGTLHTTISFGGGTVVAMDAKRQNPNGMVIGYPDLARDKATSFDKVAHSISRLHAGSCATAPAAVAGVKVTAGIETFTAVAGTTFSDAALSGGTGGDVSLSPAPTSALITLTAAGTATAAPPYSLTFKIRNSSGCVGTETVSVTEAAGVVTAGTPVFTVSPVPFRTYTPFYTLVYAPNGNWSDRCVTNTDPGGDNTLALRPCTLGRDHDQRFFALAGGAGSPVTIHNTDARHFAMENGSEGSGLFMQDSSAVNPRIPQPDSSDNRQLNVNGSTADLWTWGT
jgi:hypothetical protein